MSHREPPKRESSSDLPHSKLAPMRSGPAPAARGAQSTNSNTNRPRATERRMTTARAPHPRVACDRETELSAGDAERELSLERLDLGVHGRGWPKPQIDGAVAHGELGCDTEGYEVLVAAVPEHHPHYRARIHLCEAPAAAPLVHEQLAFATVDARRR